jgi:glycerol-3-phosphate dehydrogenase (NAD(P)+)
MTQKIGIIGGGAWGTALAQVLSKGGRDVTIWAREFEVVSSINEQNENVIFLPGVKLDRKLQATGNLEEIAENDILLLVTPTQYIRATLEQIKHKLADKPVVICSKGVELGTGLLPSQIVESVVPEAKISILTGPTFAAEAGRGLPFAVTIAAKDIKLAEEMQKALSTKTFRLYASNDIIGAQLGAAIKNVIAIACGIVHGKKLGENARAALISRGLAEIGTLCEAMGGERETLMGLCGLGDLTLTCSSMQSRNFSLGAALGEGKSADEILGARKSVTEGVFTAKSATELAKKYKIQMPITQAVESVLNHGVSVDQAVQNLMSRPSAHELPE